MNTKVDDAMNVLNDEGRYLRFGRTRNNLCAVSIGENDTDNKCFMFNTVKVNKSMFLELDCERAEASRAL